ncbi:MAG: hypothetical protein HC861_11355 [Rhodospirillaceae bacterium]|nr:hypothetical protein [Rhodospirillaceae bacterium]
MEPAQGRSEGSAAQRLHPGVAEALAAEHRDHRSGRAQPRFRVRLAGTAAVSFAGRDFTDKFLDEVIPPEQYEITVAPYVRAIAAGVPMEDDVLSRQFIAPDGVSLPVRRLVMPCSSDGARIDRFVVGLFLYRPESR